MTPFMVELGWVLMFNRSVHHELNRIVSLLQIVGFQCFPSAGFGVLGSANESSCCPFPLMSSRGTRGRRRVPFPAKSALVHE